MKTGTILLVHGTSDQAKLIQKFQKLVDKDAGYWNHSGIIVNINGHCYVVEMSQIPGRRLRAACVVTPLDHYAGYELKFLDPRFNFNEDIFFRQLASHIGKPYGYGKLIFNIPRSILYNKVTDPKDEKEDKFFGDKGDKAARRPVCHMLTMLVWNQYTTNNPAWVVPLFEDWYKADVSDIVNSEYFK